MLILPYTQSQGVIRLLIELVYHHYDFATYLCQWGGLSSSRLLLGMFIDLD